MSRESSTLWIAVILAVGVVAGLWYYSTTLQPKQRTEPLAPRQPSLPAATAPAEKQGPLHPLRDDERSDPPELRPLPDLDNSDEYFKMEAVDLLGRDLQPLFAQTRIIERIVATVDNLPRQHIAERTRPISGIPGQFVADATDKAGEFVLNPDSYRRYDELVHMIAVADLAAITDMYRRFYPLMQSAYVDLGYPNGYFNDRLVEIIDHLLETPDVAQPVALVRTHVLYQFADPDLEKRSSGQKILLRMGPDHAATVKARLAEFRDMVADQ